MPLPDRLRRSVDAVNAVYFPDPRYVDPFTLVPHPCDRGVESSQMYVIDEASVIPPAVWNEVEMAMLSQRPDMWNPIVEYRFAATDIRPITARDFYRVPPVPLVPRPATRSVVHGTQAAFRYSYTCPVQDRLKERGRMCYCSASSEPHLHQRLRRVGHLPMITVKELPE